MFSVKGKKFIPTRKIFWIPMSLLPEIKTEIKAYFAVVTAKISQPRSPGDLDGSPDPIGRLRFSPT